MASTNICQNVVVLLITHVFKENHDADKKQNVVLDFFYLTQSGDIYNKLFLFLLKILFSFNL